jgi:hypothetical protein
MGLVVAACPITPFEDMLETGTGRRLGAAHPLGHVPRQIEYAFFGYAPGAGTAPIGLKKSCGLVNG